MSLSATSKSFISAMQHYRMAESFAARLADGEIPHMPPACEVFPEMLEAALHNPINPYIGEKYAELS